MQYSEEQLIVPSTGGTGVSSTYSIATEAATALPLIHLSGSGESLAFASLATSNLMRSLLFWR
jgi:hypothetical protein